MTTKRLQVRAKESAKVLRERAEQAFIVNEWMRMRDETLMRRQVPEIDSPGPTPRRQSVLSPVATKVPDAGAPKKARLLVNPSDEIARWKRRKEKQRHNAGLHSIVRQQVSTSSLPYFAIFGITQAECRR